MLKQNKYDLHSYEFCAYTFGTFFSPKYGQKHCKSVNSDMQSKQIDHIEPICMFKKHNVTFLNDLCM